MTRIVEPTEIERSTLKEVCSVSEFARRFRIDKEEERRLRKLFGDFATRQELLSNCRRQMLAR